MAQDTDDTKFAGLRAAVARMEGRTLNDLFAADPERFDRYHVALGDLLFDYSKHRVDEDVLRALFDLARAQKLEEKRDRMFTGGIVNPTEGRAALHTALRAPRGSSVKVDGQDVMPEVLAVRAKVAEFARGVRDGTVKGATGRELTDIVNIGIGGSDLGPAMAARALARLGHPRLRTHFVSNVDGADLGDTLKGLDPATTLFIVASKTFTTQETMTNARSARAWLAAALGEDAVAHHFAAVSTALDLVGQFGIPQDRIFGFKDWVGGRYSVWSSIGLSVVIQIGPDHFADFLAGGHEVDTHFRQAPLESNIPALMGLIGVLYRNAWGFATQAVIPYDQRLGRFPAYLQQLDMESNGKHVRIDGTRVKDATGPVVWGEPGTNGQHAFFQLLHQGTEIVPIDFLVAAEPTDADLAHHQLLVANCLAQSQALMVGRSEAEVEAVMSKAGAKPEAIAAVKAHKQFDGNRPTSTFLYRRLDPRMLGRLIALYEHRVFTMAAIWDTNPFDQWGVELGKELANKLAPIVSDGAASLEGLDGSTAGLVEHRRALIG
jgi:glucose-6-phosphate isomerase